MSSVTSPDWRLRGYPDPWLPEEVAAVLETTGVGGELSQAADMFLAGLPRAPAHNLWIPREAQSAVALAAARMRDQIVEQRKGDLDQARYGMARALSVLGMWAFKRQLEDAVLELEFPDRYRGLEKRFRAFQAEHHEFTRSVEAAIEEHLGELEIAAAQLSTVWCSVDGASRRLETLRLPNFGFAQPTDFYDTHVIVHTPEECYRALQAVHEVARPAPDGFQDLIVAPHSNGFSGLTTQIQVRHFGKKPQMRAVRIILQTQTMHEIGWHGIAHPDCTPGPGDAPLFIAKLLANQGRSVGTRPTIVVYAQGGHSRRLQREAHEMEAGATVLDLAYKIHSRLGDEAISAVVDGEGVESLGQVLEDGALVEIHRASDRRNVRSEDDLDLVALPSSRRKLKRNLYQQDPTAKGRLAVLQHLNERGFSLPADELDRMVEAIAGRLKGEPVLRTTEDIYRHVGKFLDLSDRKAEAEADGRERERVRLAKELKGLNQLVSSASVAALVADEVVRVGRERLLPGDSPSDQLRPALLDDPGFRVRLATLCAVCRPGPEDTIVGRRRGSQVKVHEENCRYAGGPGLLGMQWIPIEGRVRAIINLSGADRSGLVIEVCEQVADFGCSLEQISARADHLGKARLTMHIYADSSVTVESLAAELGGIRGVAAVDHETMQLPRVGETRTSPPDEREEIALSRSHATPLALHLRPSGPPIRHGLIRIPYDPQGPCLEGPFIGRDDESDRLVRTLKQGGGRFLFISGPRTIGKSSLALRFCDRLEERHRPDTFRVDLRGCGYFSSRETFEKIVAEFRRSPIGDPTVPDHDHPARTLDALVDACDRNLLLILDEFGGPLESFRDGHLGGEFFAWIRSAMERPSQKLTLMLAGPPDAELLLRTEAQRALGERLKTFRLGVLTPEATRQMFVEPLAEEGISVKQDAEEAVATLVGGHPYYLIELLDKLVGRLNQERERWEVTRSDINKSLADLWCEDLALSGWMPEIAPTIVTRLCLDGFVRAAGRKNEFVDLETIARQAQLDLGDTRSAMEELQRCQVVRASEENPSEYRIMFPILLEWIRQGGMRRDYFAKLNGYPKGCLSVLADPRARKSGLTVPQIARALDVNRDRAEQIAEGLADEGILTKRRTRYRLGLPHLATWMAEERRWRQPGKPRS
jgi:(p)ppGpp synthase/HD superfamily hydrolase